MRTVSACGRHSCESRNPAILMVAERHWIPAFAGMTNKLLGVATQQIIDRGLRPRLRIDLLDDHRAIQRMRAVLRRQRAGDHYAARRHVAMADFTGRAVIDARALADEHTHADHAVVADDHAFDHFRTRTDEA